MRLCGISDYFFIYSHYVCTFLVVNPEKDSAESRKIEWFVIGCFDFYNISYTRNQVLFYNKHSKLTLNLCTFIMSRSKLPK